jgi:phosphoribosylaminoimidazole-succinocarboxamide synthase
MKGNGRDMRLLKSGKVKDIYEINDRELEFVFSDRISVFDKIIPSTIPNKGETLARTSAYWFGVSEELGITTHYLGLTAGNRMRVKRVQVIYDYSKITQKTTNYLIPLECIARYYAYGSLWDRIQQNRITPESVGFPQNHTISLGDPLPQPFFEVTTKLEKVDRHLSIEEALSISSVTPKEFKELETTALRIDAAIAEHITPHGLIHVDGKKEFAYDEARDIMVVDTFGTADEDRFWDAQAYRQGRFLERSKEFVRQHYRRTGYHAQLMKARNRGQEEPSIPPLPEDIIKQVSEIYIQLYEDLTGQSF